jgi:hypothetical protein
MAARALSSSASFGEDENAFPRPTAEEPNSQDTDGSGVASSDEIGENGVIVNRVPASPMRSGRQVAPAEEEQGEAAAEEDTTSAADSDAETVPPAGEVTNLDSAITPPPQKVKEAETHLKEKSDKYPHLWQMVLALEEYSFPLKKTFLKLTQSRAAKLNAKVKNLCLKEVRTQLRRTEMDRAVVTALMELIQ